MEIRGFTSEDAESAARLHIQSAEHHAELDPDFYKVPALEPVVAHYEELAERIKTEPLNCFVAESDETVVGMVEVRISDPPSPDSMLRPRRIASAGLVVALGHRRQGIGRPLMHRKPTHESGQQALQEPTGQRLDATGSERKSGLVAMDQPP